ncbi:fimbrial biogenesis chaperone [Sulfurisoma sediminicola]|uniref:Fimbrial chaperone protein n=1 Tax=Sulfurisoma sediminicola TaxID=1381557 RepID=A0A497XBK5_9PROT|nr:fimbria/pilus periplasmic chaperone [Sulfurisoma sediminicola]RLJ63710.1 fimbrial chaperone protein [Sulfurisoma sediminicola]
MTLVKRMHLRLSEFLMPGLFGLLVFGFAMPASAGMFTVTPVRIFMNPKDRAVAVTITNEGDEEIVMQADLYLWKQAPGGQDQLTATEDLLLSPPIIKLGPRARQVVRLARLGAMANPTEQLTYRMILREVPEARAAKGNDMFLQIAMAMSMPVFITPPGAKGKLGCTAERIAANAVRATCENSGNAHVHPTTLQLNNDAGEKLASDDAGGYILPEIKRSFDLKRKEGKIPAGKATLVVSLADGTTESYAITIGE